MITLPTENPDPGNQMLKKHVIRLLRVALCALFIHALMPALARIADTGHGGLGAVHSTAASQVFARASDEDGSSHFPVSRIHPASIDTPDSVAVQPAPAAHGFDGFSARPVVFLEAAVPVIFPPWQPGPPRAPPQGGSEA